VGISRARTIAALIASACVAVVLAGAAPMGPRAAAMGLGAAPMLAGGTIVGTASTKEPAPKPIRATIDPAVCGQNVPDESVVVDASGHLANVAIAVPGVKAQQPAEALFANDKCRFVPRVALMRPGGNVKMTSKDNTLHTMHAAAADGRAFFNVSIPMPNITLSRPVDRPGVVTLTCSTHTWMRGYLHVTDELTTISGADGKFRIDGVPAGTHTLRVWHESLKTAAPVRVTVKDGETVTVDLTLVK
jgi:plastocyanin